MVGERLTSWCLGLVIGGVAGFASLVLGVLMVVAGLGVATISALLLRSLAVLSGALVGAGVTALALMIRAGLACDAANRLPNRGCVAPDLTGFVLAVLTTILAGVLVGVAAFARSRRGR